jgi:uncharacterized protein
VTEPILRVERPATVGEFLARAGAFLGAREAEHNLIFALTSGLTTNPEVFPEAPRFAVVLREGAADGAGGSAEVIGAAIQTPPRNLVLSEPRQPDETDVVAGALANAFATTDLPGVLGPKVAAREFAARWTAGRPGSTATRSMAERVYRLTVVVPPRPAAGFARIAGPPDRDLLATWLNDFALEAFGEPFVEAPIYADRWVARLGGRAMWLWEADGRVVSMSGVSGPTPHGIRVGPVFTPPAARAHGYASNLVAAASQAQLDAGKTFVFLFTDLANPTSNHVYQVIGYEPVADVDEWRFTVGAGVSA